MSKQCQKFRGRWNDHEVKDETGGTDSMEQQRCQLILSYQGTEREESAHAPAPGCGMDTTESKNELNTAGRGAATTGLRSGHYPEEKNGTTIKKTARTAMPCKRNKLILNMVETE